MTDQQSNSQEAIHSTLQQSQKTGWGCQRPHREDGKQEAWGTNACVCFNLYFPFRCIKSMCLITQPCPTLCNPMDCIPPGSSVHGFSRQEYWRGLPFPSPGDLPDPGTEPTSPALQADALLSEPPGKPIWNLEDSLLSLFSFFNDLVLHAFSTCLCLTLLKNNLGS